MITEIVSLWLNGEPLTLVVKDEAKVGQMS